MRPSHTATVFFRVIYGSILFVIVLSTLEQFSGLNTDVFKLSALRFHILMAAIAAISALFEACFLKGLEGVKEFCAATDYIADAPPPMGGHDYRRAHVEEIPAIHQLARQVYGWRYQFSERTLRKWWHINQECFFVMLHNGQVVGYIDAFPVSEGDYQRLMRGQDERRISPLPCSAVDEHSSFYIASLVIDPRHRGRILVFLAKAFSHYANAYRHKPWKRICAVAYTAKGTEWVKMRGMDQVDETDMWYVNRELISRLNKKNQDFWQRILPTDGGTPSLSAKEHSGGKSPS
jgi:hypothetical protein